MGHLRASHIDPPAPNNEISAEWKKAQAIAPIKWVLGAETNDEEEINMEVSVIQTEHFSIPIMVNSRKLKRFEILRSKKRKAATAVSAADLTTPKKPRPE